MGRGAELFERVQAAGAEGIVSKRLRSPYRAGRFPDWLKTKCSTIGEVIIVGFVELAAGRIEALAVAEEIAGKLRPVGQVKFGLASRGLWPVLDAIRAGPDGSGGLRLISRNGFDRTGMFRAPFDGVLGRLRHEAVIDGEIAVPDDRGVTHIDDLHEALVRKQPEQLAFFAFDLVHFDGHDLRRCAIEDRKALLRDAIGELGVDRIVYVDHVLPATSAVRPAQRCTSEQPVRPPRAPPRHRAAPPRRPR